MLKFTTTGLAALDFDIKVPAGQFYELVSLTLNMSAAPTTGENFTITLDSVHGAIYDTQIYALDLSAGSTTDLVFADGLSGWRRVILGPGDVLNIAYANTDLNTYAIEVTMRGTA